MDVKVAMEVKEQGGARRARTISRIIRSAGVPVGVAIEARGLQRGKHARRGNASLRARFLQAGERRGSFRRRAFRSRQLVAGGAAITLAVIGEPASPQKVFHGAAIARKGAPDP